MPLISVLAFLGLIVGLFAERKGFANSTWTQRASRLLVQLIYPCLILFSLLTRFTWPDIIKLSPMPVLVFVCLGVGLLFGKLTVRRAFLSEERTRRTYIFLSIMPNYSYVPLVIAQTFWGERGLALVAIASVGADVFLWTFAFPQITGRMVWQKLLSAPLLSLIGAFLLLRFYPQLPQTSFAALLPVLGFIGKFTLPLSMYILGIQLAKTRFPIADRRAHGLLLAWRLLGCPLLMFILLLICPTELPSEARAILLLIASMPGAVVTVVLAQIYGADGKFAATQIFLGHGLALVSVGLWQLLLQYFG